MEKLTKDQLRKSLEEYIKAREEYDEKMKHFICDDCFLRERSAAVVYLKPSLEHFLIDNMFI